MAIAKTILYLYLWAFSSSFSWPIQKVCAFSPVPVSKNSHQNAFMTALQMSDTATIKSTLTDETTWKLRFVMRGLPTTKGRKVDEIFNIYAKFIEEEGYEPPQGKLQQVSMTVGEGDDEEKVDKPLFQIKDSRWQLSEDPNDRKDSLWIWGLFEEPLYPFLLLQVTTGKIPLPGEAGDAIAPLALFSQINHKREKEKGAILSRAELKIREFETVNADIFGVSTADIYEEKTVGQIVFEPVNGQ